MELRIPDHIAKLCSELDRPGGLFEHVEEYMLMYYYKQFCASESAAERELIHTKLTVLTDVLMTIKNIGGDYTEEQKMRALEKAQNK